MARHQVNGRRYGQCYRGCRSYQGIMAHSYSTCILVSRASSLIPLSTYLNSIEALVNSQALVRKFLQRLYSSINWQYGALQVQGKLVKEVQYQIFLGDLGLFSQVQKAGLENQEGFHCFYYQAFIIKIGILYLKGILINGRQVINYLFFKEEEVC